MRSLNDIKHELDEAAARRSELWKQLSEAGPDEATSTEVAALSERIESLYQEARIVRSRARFGEQEAIIARARAEERLDRELAKVA
jgi:hypothetical protein